MPQLSASWPGPWVRLLMSFNASPGPAPRSPFASHWRPGLPCTTWIKHSGSAATDTEIATSHPYEINACAIQRTKLPTYRCPNPCYLGCENNTS